MTTRKEIILGTISSLLLPFIGNGSPTKSMLGGYGAKNIFEDDTIDYVPGYTDIVDGWTPIGTGSQTITLQNPIVPLSDFTIDGSMTYRGSFSGDGPVLGLNNAASTTFSLWFRNNNILPRCFASEGTANPVAIDVEGTPTFSFSIRFDSTASTMTFCSGDLTNAHIFSTSNWTWNTAFSQIESGLTSFGMSNSRLSDINSIRVYPFLLTDDELLYNNAIDKDRFNLP